MGRSEPIAHSIEEQLQLLVKEFEFLPSGESKEYQQRCTPQECIDLLTLGLIYARFDLEASRRENHLLRKILKEYDNRE